MLGIQYLVYLRTSNIYEQRNVIPQHFDEKNFPESIIIKENQFQSYDHWTMLCLIL